MAIANINGIELFHECLGSGPPLLLIHGLGSSGDDWAFQREDFAHQHRLILVDLRGSGRSGKPAGPYSIAQFAADLWALLDLLGIDTLDVLGFSLGGSVALEMAVTQPRRVRRLVLCNALADYRIDTPRKWLEAHLQLTLVRVLGVRRTSRMIARRMFPRREQAPMRERLVQVVGDNPHAAYVATIRAIMGWSIVDQLHALRCETLIIAAQHDYITPEHRRQEARRFPHAEVVVIAGSRHGTPFDAIEAFNCHALEFLGRAVAVQDSPGDVAAVVVEEPPRVPRIGGIQHG